MQEIVTYLEQSGIKLLEAIAALVAGFTAIHYIKKKQITAKLFSRIDPTLNGFAQKLFMFLLYLLVLDIVINILGIPMTSVIALLASASVAVSLAMQGVLSNFIGGVMILMLKPFKAKDFIQAGAMEGTVETIGIFYTELTTPDNRCISIPNSSLTNTSIVNYSRMRTRRVEVRFGVSYSSDIDTVTELLRQVAVNTQYVEKTPAPQIHLCSNDDSAMTYLVRVWCAQEHYWDVNFALLRSGTLALRNANIEIPFPQMDVHIKQQ